MVEQLSLKYAIRNGKVQFSNELIEIAKRGFGTIDESLFAIEFSNFLGREAPDIYLDPRKFFRITYFTNELKMILKLALSRVGGVGDASPALVLDTTFGGGKTHTLVALYHLFSARDIAISVPEIRRILKDLDMSTIPETKIIAIDGHNIDARKELWQVLGEYLGSKELITSYLPPKVDDIQKAINSVGKPILLLLDELVSYFNSIGVESERAERNIAFLHRLMVAVGATKTSLIVLTIPQARAYEKASEKLRDLTQILARGATKIAPVSKSDIVKILKKRLVSRVDPAFAHKVAKELAVHYARHLGEIESGLRQELEESYPFNPEVIEEIFFARVGMYEKFQKTRSIIKIMAKTIINLLRHVDELPDTSLLISAGEIDLSADWIRSDLTDPDVFGEKFRQIVETDICDNEGNGHAQRRDGRIRFGDYVRIGTAVYLYSLYPEEQKAGATPKEVFRALGDTSFAPSTIEEYLEKMYTEIMIHLWRHQATGRYYFKPEVNPRALVRKYAEDVKDLEVRKHLETSFLPRIFKSTDYLQINLFVDSVTRENTNPRKLNIFVVDYERVFREYSRISNDPAYADLTESEKNKHVYRTIATEMMNITTPNRNAVVLLFPLPSMLPAFLRKIKERIAAEKLKKERKDLKNELKDIITEYDAVLTQMLIGMYSEAVYYKKNDLQIVAISPVASGKDEDKKPYSERIFKALENKKVLTRVTAEYIHAAMGHDRVYMTYKELMENVARTPALPYVPDKFLKESIKELVGRGEIAFLKWTDGIPLEKDQIHADNANKLLERLIIGKQIQEIRDNDYVLKKEYAQELIEEAMGKKVDKIANEILSIIPEEGHITFEKITRALPHYSERDLKEAIIKSEYFEIWNGDMDLFQKVLTSDPEILSKDEKEDFLNSFRYVPIGESLILSKDLADKLRVKCTIEERPQGPEGPIREPIPPTPEELEVERPEVGDKIVAITIQGNRADELEMDVSSISALLSFMDIEGTLRLKVKRDELNFELKDLPATSETLGYVGEIARNLARLFRENPDLEYSLSIYLDTLIIVNNDLSMMLDAIYETSSEKKFKVKGDN